jgi:antitoxin ParD1/3/4
MPTRNVVVTGHQAEMIDRLVTEGRYQNASEVLREGLRLVEARDAEYAAKLQAFREAVDVGIADIENGRYKRFTSADDLTAYLKNVSDEIVAEHDSH